MAVSPDRHSQITDLVHQWDGLVGYSIEVPDWAIDEMAGEPDRYVTLYDVGQYMAAHQRQPWQDPGALFVPEWYATMPWAQYGMTATGYAQKLEEFDSAFRALTGQAAPPDLVSQALHEHQGRMTQGQFSTWLQTQDSLKNTYGWLRYGLDFSQFQTRKVEMRQSLGYLPSDAEAVTQLRYMHAAQGPNLGVTAQSQQGQVERRQQQVGISGSVVR